MCSARCAFPRPRSTLAKVLLLLCQGKDQAWAEYGGKCRCLHAQAVDEGEASLAVGCKGSELSVWDLATHQRSYLAKSAKPNRIGLVDPPNVTAVAFVPGSSATKVLPLHAAERRCTHLFDVLGAVHHMAATSLGKELSTMNSYTGCFFFTYCCRVMKAFWWAAQVVVGTLQHKVRLYDTRLRRPQLQLDFGEARITALVAEPSGGCPPSEVSHRFPEASSALCPGGT